MKTPFPLVTFVAALAGALAPPSGRAAELPQPPGLRSAGGVLDARLELRNGAVSIAGRQLTLAQYEGSTPGPTWQVKPGDLLKIHLINRLALPGAPAPETVKEVCDGTAWPAAPPETGAAPEEGAPPLDLVTNLHFQGLQVPPGRQGDDPWLHLAPGEGCRYELRIPRDQPPGLYAYLPGFAGSGAKQRWQGLAGAIVVEGGLDALPEVGAAGERLLVLQELWVDRSGAVPEGEPVPAAGGTPFTTVPAAPSNVYFPVNGALQPTLTLRSGETQRWRLLAAAPHRNFLLRLDGHPLELLAQDGSPLEAARPLDTLLLAPGNRAEVLVRGGEPGTYWLRALASEQGHPGGPLPELLLVKVVVSGPPAGGEAGGKGQRRLILGRGSIYGLPVAARRTVVCGEGPRLALPGASAPAAAGEARRITVRAGDVEEWTLVNRDVVQHPFHLPGNPFQVVRINEAEVRDGSWWDTFPLPPQGEVRIRVRFRSDLSGRTAYHCQAPPFEDPLGTEGLGTLEIVPAGAQGGKPEGAAKTGEGEP